ncbi:tyrosine-type recombinase/integrase [Pediococcus acidilactici]|uniref:site-specific integrase n=2 Tax=Pediococcus acidilactici TaxID=1254 RepID=UPI00132FBD8D|nr:tyrosine-type recombinase/integrase [Pediococcus acidilactici]KAF0354751.1 tyrosine-type recombinase/integrase [Pediococcus acidilactici]KAF0358984.1 tyrosine-type recombinase/integrase [Pediococcus acidilactici]KAF0448193.1 tyrosine-type recombinase/integrase [Pediococcus acidilactici]
MSVRKKQDGSWEAVISWYDSLGKRRYKTKRGFATKTEAMLGEAKLRLDYEETSVREKVDQQETFADYFKNWYVFYKKPKVSKVSLHRYQYAYNVIVEYFDNKLLKDVTRANYQKFIVKYGQNHSPNTMKMINNCIKACIKNAVYDEEIKKDFTYNIELISNKDKVVQVEYLNVAEIKELLSNTLSKLNPRYTSNYMIVTAILTGARLSEIAGLTWKDINFDFKTININKSYDYFTKDFKPTKNKSSNRIIKINDTLCEVLKELRANHTALVFENQRRLIPTSGAVNKALRARLSELNISKHNFHFHSLRHSHVAYLLSQGVDIYPIARRLGHSDITTTTRTYAYLIDEYKDRNDAIIIAGLDRLLDDKKPLSEFN